VPVQTELDKALGVDAYPDRQDLSLELLLIAREEGTRIVIDTDAHAPEQLGLVELGLAAALLAGIPEERIVNFMPVQKLG
jgi:putative hydrolase